MPLPNAGLMNFAERAENSVGIAASARRFNDTRSNRILRRFSIRETSEMIGFDRAFVTTWLDHEDAPDGVVSGRERLLSMADVLQIRAMAASRPKGRRPTLFWRAPGSRLPVITIASQKGGTSKTLTAAHLAQYASMMYGLRVGVIDADPQSSLSLYFADDLVEFAGIDTETFASFMGVAAPRKPPSRHEPARLDAFWKRTPWPGIRLMPGGPEIQEADIALFVMANDRALDRRDRHNYRFLRDTLHRWADAHPPRTTPRDLYDARGRFRQDAFETALYETLDLVVIDTAPSLTLPQLNAVLAADTLIIPQTMKGFDLSTLRIYLNSLCEYLRYIRIEGEPIEFPPLPSYILPTQISTQSDTDLRHVGELYAADPDVVMPVYYARSEAIANAAENYLSIYEYDPPRARRASAAAFVRNANAVCDAILTRAIPELPSRGFANAFIRQHLPEGIPAWTEEAA